MTMASLLMVDFTEDETTVRLALTHNTHILKLKSTSAETHLPPVHFNIWCLNGTHIKLLNCEASYLEELYF